MLEIAYSPFLGLPVVQLRKPGGPTSSHLIWAQVATKCFCGYVQYLLVVKRRDGARSVQTICTLLSAADFEAKDDGLATSERAFRKIYTADESTSFNESIFDSVICFAGPAAFGDVCLAMLRLSPDLARPTSIFSQKEMSNWIARQGALFVRQGLYKGAVFKHCPQCTVP